MLRGLGLDLNRRLARKRYELDLIVDDAFPRALPEGIGREIVSIVQEAQTPDATRSPGASG